MYIFCYDNKYTNCYVARIPVRERATLFLYGKVHYAQFHLMGGRFIIDLNALQDLINFDKILFFICLNEMGNHIYLGAMEPQQKHKDKDGFAENGRVRKRLYKN